MPRSHFHRILKQWYDIEGVPRCVSSHCIELVQRLLHDKPLTEENIRQVLRDSGNMQYYEDVPQIVHCLTAEQFPKINSLQLTAITKVFDEYYKLFKVKFPKKSARISWLAYQIPKLFGIQPTIKPANIWNEHWNQIFCEEPTLQQLYFNYHTGIIQIQREWRRVLAQRRLQRLKLSLEIEYLPGVGIKYFDGLTNWRSRTKSTGTVGSL